MGAFILLAITFLPGLLVLTLGIAPGLAGNALALEATWVRVIFLLSGTATTLLGLRAIARQLLGAKVDEEARLKRAPLVGTALTGSGVLLLATVLAGEAALSGEAVGPLRVMFGLYAVWLVLFGAPMFFARKLQKIQPPAGPTAPPSCSRCGVQLAAEARICSYCGTPVG